METFILNRDFNWFGKTIPAGSIYKQQVSNKDNYCCFTTEGTQCPHWDLTFMTVRNNHEWFTQLNERALRAAFPRSFERDGVCLQCWIGKL